MPIFKEEPLASSFYTRPTLDVAAELPGKFLVTQRSGGPLLAARITEVEAYLGQDDPASHAYRGPRGRAAIMYGPPGILYVYFTYGMHFCMNAVAHRGRDAAGAILLRAAEPVTGMEQMLQNRGCERTRERVARGPACLTSALGVNRDDNGRDLRDGPIRIHAAPNDADDVGYHICTSTRIGIRKAIQAPWRFFLCGHPSLSGTAGRNQCKQRAQRTSRSTRPM